MTSHPANPALEAELAYRRELVAAAAQRAAGPRWHLPRRRTR